MRFELVGFGDLGSLHVGMTREQSRAVLGDGFEEFLKTADSSVPTDAYDDPGMHVYFDEHYNIVGVEFLKWSDLNWRGRRLSGVDGLEVQRFLLAQGEVLSSDASGFYVEGLGLKFYSPDMDEDGATIEAVYVSFVRAL